VQLELRRKLVELDERFAMEVTLRPIVLLRTTIPVLVVTLNVFRKQAQRSHSIVWNPLLKQFEPLRCSRCTRSVFTVAFANETVAPLCITCAG
jgi:hypothetical protein